MHAICNFIVEIFNFQFMNQSILQLISQLIIIIIITFLIAENSNYDIMLIEYIIST